MSKPVIAIVGRPNVGKSMLFNKITGTRSSIVEDRPGVTRDRLYGEGEWRGRSFVLVDTGGIEPEADTDMLKFMRMQAEIAVEHADVVLFLTDLTTGLTASDTQVANILRRSRKPVVLCVNKADSVGETPVGLYEFYNLGVGEPYPVSALHGHGTGDVLDACFDYFPPEQAEEEEEGVIKVAVIGKPNAGKSSLINTILGEERVIVSDVAGTTRDSVDAYFENKYGKFCFIDTAGIRRKVKIEDAVEKYSVLRALMAMDRADVCVIMLDANDGVTEQDARIAGFAHEKGKASVIVVNKWDTVEKETNTMANLEKDVLRDLSYMSYAPVVFLSAKYGSRVQGLFPQIVQAAEQTKRRIPTGLLNDVLADAITRMQPPTDRGKRLKIYYMTQVSTCPPTFLLFCNDRELFHFSYLRYIENRLREMFGFAGTPLKLIVREKGDNDNHTV